MEILWNFCRNFRKGESIINAFPWTFMLQEIEEIDSYVI